MLHLQVLLIVSSRHNSSARVEVKAAEALAQARERGASFVELDIVSGDGVQALFALLVRRVCEQAHLAMPLSLKKAARQHAAALAPRHCVGLPDG